MMIMVTEPENDFEETTVKQEVVQTPHLKIASLMFLLFGFYFLIFAMVQFILNTHEHHYTLPLVCEGRNCKAQTPSLIFAEDQLVNIYLKTEVFQKDINIINSYSPSQVEGNYFEDADVFYCHNTLTNEEMDKKYNVFGELLENQQVSFPCGRRLLRFPEGKIELYSYKSLQKTQLLPSKTTHPFARSFPYTNYNLSLQWIDITQPEFARWMTELSSRDRSMYWTSFKQEISGIYEISYILSNDSYVSNYQLIITDSMTFGGKNSELCYINLSMSIICFVCAIVSYLANKKSTKVFDIQ